MNSQLFFLMVLNCLSLGLLIFKQNKTNKKVSNILKQLVVASGYKSEDDIIILGLDYQSAIFSEVNELLSNIDYSIFIVLFSPKWLVITKKKVWAKHTIIHMSQLTMHELFWDKITIIKSNGIMISVREIVEFIKNNR